MSEETPVHNEMSGSMQTLPFAKTKSAPTPATSLKPSSTTTAKTNVTKSSSSKVSARTIRAEAVRLRKDVVGWNDVSDDELLLRLFDLNLAYGPQLGVTRSDRWQLAVDNNLAPPAYIPQLIAAAAADGGENNDASVWEDVNQRQLLGDSGLAPKNV
jgi:hypothetical protein